MTKIGIIGATGYAGLELVRILLRHKGVTLTAISSHSFEGKKLSEVYPSLAAMGDMTLENEDSVIEKCDVIFACLPHGLSEKLAAKVEDKLFIDLGADFRLDESDYKEWYGLDFASPELHENAVYSIPELDREKVSALMKKKGPKIIGNPGCYPTSVTLAAAPILKAGLNEGIIIADSKSGVTGAGRGLTQTTHFPDNNEAFSAYKLTAHRHTPEIERNLSLIAGDKVSVIFSPHLLPLNRGILSTVYIKMKSETDLDKLYREFYKDEKFVRILKSGDFANVKYVRCSNYCDISLHYDKRTQTAIVCSAIDNMVKGAAGQAVQNMNIALGLCEDEGIDMIPTAF